MDKPVVERRYLEEPDACVRAVELLLKRHASKRGRLPDKSGPDDGTKVKGDSADEQHIR